MSGVLKISDISHNFLSLAVAIQQNSVNAEKYLIPSLWGNNFYTGGIRKPLLLVIYYVWSCFDATIRERKIHACIKKTHESFLYYVAELGKDKINTTTWNNWMTPVLRQAVWLHLPEVIHFFDTHLKMTTRDIWEFLAIPIFKRVAKEQHIVSMEVQTQAKVPTKTLIRVLDAIEERKPIAIIDTKSLTEWLKKICVGGLRGKVHVQNLHKTIKAVIRKEKGLKEESEVIEKAAKLEWYLEKAGIEIFYQEDKKQIELSQELLSKKRLVFIENDLEKNLSLADVRGERHLHKENSHVVIELENNLKQLLKIPKNRARVHIDWITAKMEGESHPKPVEMEMIDPRGRYYFVPRYDQNLAEHAWASSEKINRKDEKVLTALIVMLKAMVNDQYLLDGLELEKLKIDMKEYAAEIRLTHFLAKKEFNFNEAEEFIYDCAKGGKNNLATWEERSWLFKKLMTGSGMRDKPIALYYLNYIKALLHDESFNPKLEAADLLENEQPIAVERALQLEMALKKMVELGENRLKAISGLNQAERLMLLQEYKKSLYHHYLESGSAGCLWPAIEDRALHDLSQKHELLLPNTSSAA